MKNESINEIEFKIAAYKKGTDVIDSIENSSYVSNSTSRKDASQVLVPPTDGVDITTPARAIAPSMLGLGTMILTTFIWIVCTVSLILNITRKNTGKAIFSGIAYIIPIVNIALVTIGSAFEILPLLVIALIFQIITLIIVFIFCFSKNKNITNNQ